MDLELSFRSTSPAANKLLQGTSAIDQAGLTKPRWKKLLYIKQEYPDNYVDHTFLEEMQKNTNVRAYDYWSVVQESGVVTQHLSSIVIFVTAFIHVYYEDISIYSLITSSSALSLIAYIVWDIYVLQGQDKPRSSISLFRKYRLNL
jgi:phosphatidylinositol glycan class C protein